MDVHCSRGAKATAVVFFQLLTDLASSVAQVGDFVVSCI